MGDLLKLLAVLGLIVLLLRKKVSVGYVMYISTAVLAALYLMRPGIYFSTFADTLRDPVTLKLLVALSMIRVFELILREHEVLKEMMQAARSIFKNRKATIISMPLLIGMLPVVGGAYFSAPMVDEATRGLKMDAAEKGFVNYWFRHPWEYILPLYPGVLLAAALTSYDVRALIIANLPYSLAMGVGGLLVSMKGIKAETHATSITHRQLLSFLPITLLLLMVIVAHIELHLAILVIAGGLLLWYRYSPREILRTLRHGVNWDMIVLITGVLYFRGIMEASGAVANLSAYFTEVGVPLAPVLIVLPFITGLLTGLTIGFVGASFPLLISLPGGDALGAISLAFAAGFLGVLFSPVHVCLVLTREYFKAKMMDIYKRMLLPSALVMAAGLAVYYLAP